LATIGGVSILVAVVASVVVATVTTSCRNCLDTREYRRTMSAKTLRGTGLERDLLLLEHVAAAEARGEGGLGVTRLAGLTGRDKSFVSRAMRRLSDAGLIERDAASREYRVGWGLFAMAARVSEGRLMRLAPPVMAGLCQAIGETVHLCILRGSEVMTIHTESPGHGFRASGWLGVPVPAWSTSAGRALLFDASPAELARRFGHAPFPAPPDARVQDRVTLAAVIAEARLRGFVAVDEEFEAGVAGVSAPIRDFSGRVVAAINVSAPADRFRPVLQDVGAQTCVAASEIAASIGWNETRARRFEGPA
jgi:IclR family transcriptional regulator, KDG regulon repressor